LNTFWNIIQIYAILFGTLSLCVLPCWCFCGRLKMSSSVRLFVTAAFNFALFYLLEWLTYTISLPIWFPASVLLVLTAVSLFLILSKKVPLSLTVSGLVFWAVLATWILSFQLGVVVYGGANWFGDWRENYERALFFLEQKPLETRILLNVLSLPSRGPLFNSSASVLMNIFGKEFWFYQIISTVLNTFAILPFALLIQSIVKIKQAAAHWLSLFIMMFAPFAFQIELHTNTIFFTLAFILGAVYLYRRSVRTDRPYWSVGSMIVFSLGFLAHYLVFPIALFFAGHFFFVTVKRKWGIKPLLFSFLGCGILVSSWFLYLFFHFGLDKNLKSNNSIGQSYSKFYQAAPGKSNSSNNVVKENLLTTIIPYSFRRNWEGIAAAPIIVQKDGRFGKIFEPQESNSTYEWYCDIINNQGSLLSNIGIAGFLGLYLAAGWIVRNSGILQNRAKQAKTLLGWKFWALFFGVGIPLNIALSPNPSPFGTAHLNLQIFVCLTAIWIFKYSQKIPTAIKKTLAIIFVAESFVTLWAWISLLNRPVPIFMDETEKLFASGELGLNIFYVNNYILKLKTHSIFLSEKMSGNGLQIGLLINVALLIATSWISYSIYKKDKRPNI
jgi:hypothetical protein